jgi:hypothetical protein
VLAHPQRLREDIAIAPAAQHLLLNSDKGLVRVDLALRD